MISTLITKQVLVDCVNGLRKRSRGLSYHFFLIKLLNMYFTAFLIWICLWRTGNLCKAKPLSPFFPLPFFFILLVSDERCFWMKVCSNLPKWNCLIKNEDWHPRGALLLCKNPINMCLSGLIVHLSAFLCSKGDSIIASNSSWDY